MSPPARPHQPSSSLEMHPQLQSSQSIQSIQSIESTTSYAITNDVVLRRDVVSRGEAQRTDEAVASPSIAHSKQHPLRALPRKGVTTAMIHHANMDLQ